MTSQELIVEAGKTDRQYWGDLCNYRELFDFLAWRDILVRYKQTVIGMRPLHNLPRIVRKQNHREGLLEGREEVKKFCPTTKSRILLQMLRFLLSRA